MRERFIAKEPSVVVIKKVEKNENGDVIRTIIEKTFSNQSKQDRETIVYRALMLHKVSVLPKISNNENKIIYEIPKGIMALELIEELSELDIESDEWFKEKEFIINTICEWLTCFYLALHLVFGQKWTLGKFDFNDFLFDEEGTLCYTDFEECIVGYWEDEIAKICSTIIRDIRMPIMVRTELARSFKSKMITDLNLDKARVHHQFLKLNYKKK